MMIVSSPGFGLVTSQEYKIPVLKAYFVHFIYSSKHWAISRMYAAPKGRNMGRNIMEKSALLQYSQREECKKSRDKFNEVRGVQNSYFFL